MAPSVVHVVRHGQVHNPDAVLYGRLSGFGLSDLGKQMAQRIAESIGDRDITHMRTSPLERAQETGAPLATVRGLTPVIDPRVIESGNKFEGINFSAGAKTFLKRPGLLRHMYNPMKPSWGEPYVDLAARMQAAVDDAREKGRGHEVVIVSHQAPIWMLRLAIEGRRFVHDPRRRECTLASLTSLTYRGDELESLAYSEPAASLLPQAQAGAGA